MARFDTWRGKANTAIGMGVVPVTLDIKALTKHARPVRQIETINAQNAPTGTHPFEQDAQAVRFQTHRSDFAYRVHFE